MANRLTKSSFQSIIILCVFLIICDLGLLTQYDGVLAAIILSLLFPQHSLTLLIAISSYQDSPGLSSWGWYLAFVFVAAVLISRHLRTILNSIVSNSLVLYSSILVSYSLLSSLIFNITGIFPQAAERPFYVVGVLIYVMILAAYAGVLETNKKSQGFVILSLTAGILILHSIAVTFGQLLISPLFLSSPHGSSAILESSQLIEASSMGIPRLTGTYNTPNGFAFCGVLLSLLYYKSRINYKFGFADAVIYISLTLFFSIIAQSKALILFSLLSSFAFAFLMIKKKSARYLMAFFALYSFLAILSLDQEISQIDFSAMISAFRVDNILDIQNFGYRTQAWALVLNDFDFNAWVFGTGLSHWPVFFKSKLPFSLSDPHTFVLSYIGTFGVLGVSFFGYILFRILRRFSVATSEQKFILISLLLIFLVKDLFSIPYLLGNTPITFLIWLILFQALSKRSPK